jgi:hypothetical protein
VLYTRFDDAEGAAGALTIAWKAAADDPAAIWYRIEALQVMTDAGRGTEVLHEWEELDKAGADVRAIARLNRAQIDFGRSLYGSAREHYNEAAKSSLEGSALRQAALDGVRLVDQTFAVRDQALERAAALALSKAARATIDKATRGAPMGDEAVPVTEPDE